MTSQKPNPRAPRFKPTQAWRLRSLLGALCVLLACAGASATPQEEQAENEVKPLNEGPEPGPTPAEQEAEERNQTQVTTKSEAAGQNLPAPSGPVKILVLDVKTAGELKRIGDVAGRTLTTRLGIQPELDVVSAEEVAQMLEVEGAKAAAGCDDDSCLAEIAGALGARFVVASNLEKLADGYYLQASVFDAQSANVIARDELRAITEEVLIERMALVADALFAQLASDPAIRQQIRETGTVVTVQQGSQIWGAFLQGVLIMSGATAAAVFGSGLNVIIATAATLPALTAFTTNFGLLMVLGLVAVVVIPPAAALGVGFTTGAGWLRTIPAAVLACLFGAGAGTVTGAVTVLAFSPYASQFSFGITTTERMRSQVSATVVAGAIGALPGAAVGGAVGASVGF